LTSYGVRVQDEPTVAAPMTDDDNDHDPFNEPERAHPRARELLVEDFLWDCADEEAPFGSDEGHDAYYEYRRWRASAPAAPLTDCLSWIMSDRLARPLHPRIVTSEHRARVLAAIRRAVDAA
jgi:hypothetical protein